MSTYNFKSIGELSHPSKEQHEYFITDLTEKSDITPSAQLNSIVGKVILLSNHKGEAFNTLLNTGEFNITPYGYGDKDTDGNITNFNLIGFNISRKQ